MARLTGIISKLKGSAGNLTFRRDRGKTLVSEKVTETTNAKTELQLKHRMKWVSTQLLPTPYKKGLESH